MKGNFRARFRMACADRNYSSSPPPFRTSSKGDLIELNNRPFGTAPISRLSFPFCQDVEIPLQKKVKNLGGKSFSVRLCHNREVESRGSIRWWRWRWRGNFITRGGCRNERCRLHTNHLLLLRAPYRVRSNSHYYLSFENKLLDLFPHRPTSPPSCSSSSLLFLLSRLPIIISTRMTRAPLLSSTFPRIGSPPSFGHTMMHPTGYYIYIYISLADFYYIAFDFFKKGPAYTT